MPFFLIQLGDLWQLFSGSGLRHDAAVDLQHLPVDKATSVTGQQIYHRGDIVGRTELADRNGLFQRGEVAMNILSEEYWDVFSTLLV